MEESIKTKYVVMPVDGRYGVQFWIGHQGFTVNYWVDERDEAEWMIEMLKKAHNKLSESIWMQAIEAARIECFREFNELARKKRCEAGENEDVLNAEKEAWREAMDRVDRCKYRFPKDQ